MPNRIAASVRLPEHEHRACPAIGTGHVGLALWMVKSEDGIAPDPLHGNNTTFQIMSLTSLRNERLHLVWRFNSEAGQDGDEQ